VGKVVGKEEVKEVGEGEREEAAETTGGDLGRFGVLAGEEEREEEEDGSPAAAERILERLKDQKRFLMELSDLPGKCFDMSAHWLPSFFWSVRISASSSAVQFPLRTEGWRWLE
jgi:hypothetical protein